MARRLPDLFNVTDARFCAEMEAEREWEEEKRKDQERCKSQNEEEKRFEDWSEQASSEEIFASIKNNSSPWEK